MPYLNIPKSLTLFEMMKLGKVFKPSNSSVPELYTFNKQTMYLAVIPQKVEFQIENNVMGQGGFCQKFKATSTDPG